MSDPRSADLVVARGEDAATTRLARAVQALAEPPRPRAVARRMPVTPGRTENLVLEFDEAYTAWVEGFEALPDEEQLLALQHVDRQLASMVAAKDAALWTEQAHREAGVWQEVRVAATRVIALFEWSSPVGVAAPDEPTG